MSAITPVIPLIYFQARLLIMENSPVPTMTGQPKRHNPCQEGNKRWSGGYFSVTDGLDGCKSLLAGLAFSLSVLIYLHSIAVLSFWSTVYYLPIAAVTNDPQLNGSKEHKFTLLSLWRSEVWNGSILLDYTQGVGRAVCLLEVLGENVSLFSF